MTRRSGMRCFYFLTTTIGHVVHVRNQVNFFFFFYYKCSSPMGPHVQGHSGWQFSTPIHGLIRFSHVLQNINDPPATCICIVARSHICILHAAMKAHGSWLALPACYSSADHLKNLPQMSSLDKHETRATAWNLRVYLNLWYNEWLGETSKGFCKQMIYPVKHPGYSF